MVLKYIHVILNKRFVGVNCVNRNAFSVAPSIINVNQKHSFIDGDQERFGDLKADYSDIFRAETTDHFFKDSFTLWQILR
jgi:hypothetical protein